MGPKDIPLLALVVFLSITAFLLARHLWFGESFGGPPADAARAEAQIFDLALAIDRYRLAYKRLPTGLAELTSAGERNEHPFIASIPPDPWGHAYRIKLLEPRRPGGPVLD